MSLRNSQVQASINKDPERKKKIILPQFHRNFWKTGLKCSALYEMVWKGAEMPKEYHYMEGVFRRHSLCFILVSVALTCW